MIYGEIVNYNNTPCYVGGLKAITLFLLNKKK